MKASDIPDEAIYELIANKFYGGEPTALMIYDAIEAFPNIPEKVVTAKLCQMVAHGRLRGCTCGCRGDFRFPWEDFGYGNYEDRHVWREKMAEYLKGPRIYGY